jgi:hypothetical protein
MRLGSLKLLEFFEQHLRPRTANPHEPQIGERRSSLLGIALRTRRSPSRRTIRIISPYNRRTVS